MTTLYGFGRRGVAIHPPDTDVGDGFGPIPLYTNREEVQRVIDERNARHGIGALHVIEYAVTS